MSLVVSTFAVCISIFNVVMCTPNEFDPIVVELEFKKRHETDYMLWGAKDFLKDLFQSKFVKPKSHQ